MYDRNKHSTQYMGWATSNKRYDRPVVLPSDHCQPPYAHTRQKRQGMHQAIEESLAQAVDPFQYGRSSPRPWSPVSSQSPRGGPQGRRWCGGWTPAHTGHPPQEHTRDGRGRGAKRTLGYCKSASARLVTKHSKNYQLGGLPAAVRWGLYQKLA